MNGKGMEMGKKKFAPTYPGVCVRPAKLFLLHGFFLEVIEKGRLREFQRERENEAWNRKP